jgi:predicted dehydrogenase
MNIGVIGVGVMGKNHVRIYSDLKKVERVYIYDTDLKKAEKISKEYNGISCNSLEMLLSKVDAVSICVPTKFHFEMVKKVIRYNLHCLIEKPITSNFNEGLKLLKILKKFENKVIGVGHVERFNPVVNEIKKIIDNPYYIEIKRHNPTSIRVTDVSVVEDLMIHDIDILFNVLLEDVHSYKISAAGNNDICEALFQLDDSMASLSASKVALKKFRTIYIEDVNLTIEGDLMSQELYIYKSPRLYDKGGGGYAQENIIEKVLVNKVEPLREELKTFVECIERGEDFPVTPEQAVKNLKICEEIKRHIP